jgi:hypothetical protein
MHCARWLIGPLVVAIGLVGCGTEGDDGGPEDLAQLSSAQHSWTNGSGQAYHWARTSNPFTLALGDNVSSTWDSHLEEASADWTASAVLDTTVVTGGTSPRTCKRRPGRVEVCNARYGFNGWLGVATIWLSGVHITAGTVKLNDSYFNAATYNTYSWRQFVMCQEIGHTFGLDHQDEDFDNPNLGSCMDYTSNPADNVKPNQHDYDELETIYAHLDSTTTLGVMVASANLPSQANDAADDATDDAAPSAWGRLIWRGANGRSAVYELDLGGGHKVRRFVIWA